MEPKRGPSTGSVGPFLDAVQGTARGAQDIGPTQTPQAAIADISIRLLRILAETPSVPTAELFRRPDLDNVPLILTLNQLKDLGLITIETPGENAVVKLTPAGEQVAADARIA